MPVLSVAELDKYIGKSIKDICDTGFTDFTHNHCAHFVSHVLDITHGTICGAMKWDTRHKGNSIRCDEIYNNLTLRGEWADKPIDTVLLIFVTPSNNVANNLMTTHPKKHVGIWCGGVVYNYSNSNNKVVKDSSPDVFLSKFKNTYGSKTSLYYGVIPS